MAGRVAAFLGEWVDSLVILGVVVINAIVEFLQETKAENAIETLARMVGATRHWKTRSSDRDSLRQQLAEPSCASVALVECSTFTSGRSHDLVGN